MFQDSFKITIVIYYQQGQYMLSVIVYLSFSCSVCCAKNANIVGAICPEKGIHF